MKRSQSRETAFLVIFEKSFHDEPIEVLLENAREIGEIQINEFAEKLIATTFQHVELIDEKIKQYSIKWKINRLSKVALAILRLALCEIDYYEDIPISVSINEAVELAKKFASPDDASFINGLLGAYVKDLPTENEEPKSKESVHPN